MTSFKDAMWIAKYNENKIMSEQQQIEEILLEANAYNLKWEVDRYAKTILKEHKSDLSNLGAYVIAHDFFISYMD